MLRRKLKRHFVGILGGWGTDDTRIKECKRCRGDQKAGGERRCQGRRRRKGEEVTKEEVGEEGTDWRYIHLPVGRARGSPPPDKSCMKIVLKLTGGGGGEEEAEGEEEIRSADGEGEGAVVEGISDHFVRSRWRPQAGVLKSTEPAHRVSLSNRTESTKRRSY